MRKPPQGLCEEGCEKCEAENRMRYRWLPLHAFGFLPYLSISAGSRGGDTAAGKPYTVVDSD